MSVYNHFLYSAHFSEDLEAHPHHPASGALRPEHIDTRHVGQRLDKIFIEAVAMTSRTLKAQELDNEVQCS